MITLSVRRRWNKFLRVLTLGCPCGYRPEDATNEKDPRHGVEVALPYDEFMDMSYPQIPREEWHWFFPSISEKRPSSVASDKVDEVVKKHAHDPTDETVEPPLGQAHTRGPHEENLNNRDE